MCNSARKEEAVATCAAQEVEGKEKVPESAMG